MRDMILIVDHQHEFSRMIARKLRAERFYCRVVPGDMTPEQLRAQEASGIVLAGGLRGEAPTPAQVAACEGVLALELPVLAMGDASLALLCALGGRVGDAFVQGQALTIRYADIPVFDGLGAGERWLAQAREVDLPAEVTPVAGCDAGTVAFGHSHRPVYGVQFQVEQNDPDGMAILSNFAQRICRCTPWWSTEAFIERSKAEIAAQAEGGRALCAVSGGVDSTVCALLAHLALGERMQALVLDNGLLREGEAQATFDMLSNLDVDTARMDVTAQTFEALRGLTDLDAKRRAVVGVMHRAMDAFAGALDGASILLQGTNYSDITIGHVPDTAGSRLRTLLPLRELFKDEVRRVAEQLGLPAEVARRQPFPAAGLAMRIAGETTPERVRMLRAADAVFAAEIREAGQEKRLTRFYPTLASGAPFGDDDPVRPGALAAADDGAEVVRVGHLIQHHDERFFAALPRPREDVLDGGVRPRRAEGQKPLMGGIDLVQPVALHELHHHARLPRHAHDVARRAGEIALGHQQLFQRRAALERLADGVAPHQQVLRRLRPPLLMMRPGRPFHARRALAIGADGQRPRLGTLRGAHGHRLRMDAVVGARGKRLKGPVHALRRGDVESPARRAGWVLAPLTRRKTALVAFAAVIVSHGRPPVPASVSPPCAPSAR